MKNITFVKLLSAGLLSMAPLVSHALSAITDNPNDFLGTFSGSSASKDLDVISQRCFMTRVPIYSNSPAR